MTVQEQQHKENNVPLFRHVRAALGCALIAPTLALADLPLTVEDLITDQGKIKLDATLVYANSERQGVQTGEPIVVQTGPTSFITLPTRIGDTRTNTDTLVATLGLRYGLTRDAELYGRAGYLHSLTRTSDLSGVTSSNDNRFSDAWLGVNYRFLEDNVTPALLGFAEGALRERHRESSASGKSWLAGLTTYRALDPVVLSLTTAYRWNQARRDGATRYRPGNLILLNPSVAFAVNDRVTLTTGVQWTSRLPDRYDGTAQGYRRTATDLLLGAGYGISKDSLLNVSFNANASGRNGADLRLNWLHAF